MNICNHQKPKDRGRALTALLCLALVCAGATAARAATIIVTSTADDGSAGTLRVALASAADGDTVDATGVSGTIVLTTGELVVTKSVIIVGPGPATLAVDGNFPITTNRVFHVGIDQVFPVVAIYGLTVTHGSVIDDFGGGIFNYASTLTVSNCTITGNSAINNGGGAGIGGGIENFDGDLTVIASTISGNSAYLGGGIGDASGPLTVIASTISGNSAVSTGGGIDIRNAGAPTRVTVSTCTISGNSAFRGGGIADTVLNGAFPSLLKVVASTFSGNSASILGGGILNQNPFGNTTVEIGDTILNAGASGANIESGTVTSDGYNLSSDNGGGWLTATGDQINTDPMLGPLQDNGGPTFTHEVLCGPAIDQGKNFGLTTDQRGQPRPFDSPAIASTSGGDGSDIGAFERQTACASGVNHPPVALCKDVTVTAGASCTGGTADASIDNGSFDPDPGDTITLSQSPAGPYPVGTNTVTLTVTDSHSASSNCTATVIVQPGPANADLILSMSASQTSAKYGQQLTYILTVRDLGPCGAANVVVNDALPSSTTFVSASATKGQFTKPVVGQSGVVTWYVGNMNNGDGLTAQLKVTVILRHKGTVTNTATASADTTDPNPANNTASITLSVK
jgi:uncharacterized repeat protein (TIGR01451 family)